ncbi:hypothetical protein MUN74_02305 [Agromyces endophyticus]|uniref:hypothetical protein n=1 Tax=Agromyces sp. H17E-10 TaxID=2932244 RepID=UPI001FD10077|nr:hypothetical protein [Agromyces sp. H17E-10]UOQ89773.1 hypothetical protein MUN74_02305 [Agromyces sp. H17E-10]
MNRRDERPDGPDDRGPAASDSSAGGGARSALVVVSVLLFGEAVLVTVLLGWLLIDLFSLEPSSMATAVALTVLVAVGAIWVWAVAVASLRRAPWSRAAAIVWQILQISVAVGAFQGLFARPDVGWLLLVPAVTVIGLLLWTPVRIAYSRPEDRPLEEAPPGA